MRGLYIDHLEEHSSDKSILQKTETGQNAIDASHASLEIPSFFITSFPKGKRRQCQPIMQL